MMTNQEYKPLTTGGYANPKMLQEYRDRLCYLEDCIENGTLVFLPCKVGSEFWYINKFLKWLSDSKLANLKLVTMENEEMTKRERLWEKVKTEIVNTKWTDSSLASFAETALNCDECPAFAACDYSTSCCVTLFGWLRVHGDEEVEE